MKKPKVAIVDNSLFFTGALNSILSFAEFSRAEFNFIFLMPKGGKANKRIKQLGYEVVEFEFIEINKNWKNLIFYLPYLARNTIKLLDILKKERIDILHVNDFYNMVGPLAIAFGSSSKLITHVRFMPDRFPSALVKVWLFFNLKYAKVLVPVSKAVERLLPNNPIIHINYDGFNCLPNCKKISKEEKIIKLLYLGHFIPGKGQDLAIEAFYMAYKQNSNLRLRLVGGEIDSKKNKTFKSQLIAKVKELQIEEAIEFASEVSSVIEEFASADIALNFSESESFSMTCLEALGNGVPLIASDCGGPAELFEHGRSGYLVPNRDVEAMCSAILHLAGDSEKRLKFSRNSIIFVKDKFSPSFTFYRLQCIYKKVLTE